MKIAPSFLAMALLAVNSHAVAEIVFIYGVPATGTTAPAPTILVTPPNASASPEVARNLARAHAWSSYQKNNPATAAPLVYGGASFGPLPPAAAAGGMSSIIVVTPGTPISPWTSYSLQRGQAWSNYQQGNAASGLPLIYGPGYVAPPSSPREASVRGNVSRAQAFRQGYYK